ncbi:Uncharacterised protein [Mycobacteroides abscessus subsp. abscessus]|nr:Uncharacterised protein [Mycobacteroides abscessus]SKR87732.1 Uncharacterised protein [Mycobacteroides abscessus subsp. abscessus]
MHTNKRNKLHKLNLKQHNKSLIMAMQQNKISQTKKQK